MAGTNLSTLSIQVGMDSNAAERGFNRLGALIDGMSSKISMAAMAGSAIGTAMGAAAVEFGRRVESMIQSVVKFRMEADKANFQKMIDAGASVESVVNSKDFNESVLGGMMKMKSAWDEMLESVTSIFAPALSGVFTGIGASLKALMEWAKELFDSEDLGIEDMFQKSYEITIDIAKMLVWGGAELLKYALSVKDALAKGFDSLAAFAPGKGMVEGIVRKGLADAGVKGIDDGMNDRFAWIDQQRDKLRGGLDRARKNPPNFNIDWDKFFKRPEVKPANVELFDPKSVFAPLMERGGMEDWRQTQIQRGVAQESDNKKAVNLLMKIEEQLKKLVEKPIPGAPGGIVAIGQGILGGLNALGLRPN